MTDSPVPQPNALCEAASLLMRMLGCTTIGKQRLMWIPLQATLLPGPFEDEVDTYKALALAGRVSELSIEQKRGYVCLRPR